MLFYNRCPFWIKTVSMAEVHFKFIFKLLDIQSPVLKVVSVLIPLYTCQIGLSSMEIEQCIWRLTDYNQLLRWIFSTSKMPVKYYFPKVGSALTGCCCSLVDSFEGRNFLQASLENLTNLKIQVPLDQTV